MTASEALVLPLVLVFDDNHARHAAVVLHSAAAALERGYVLEAHLIVSGLGEPARHGLERVAASHGNLEILVHHSGTDRYEQWLHGGHISAAAYLRLELADHLPATTTKALYLDTDVWCRDSLHHLFEIDLAGRTLGAVRDTTTPVASAQRGIVNHLALGIAADAPYFNSGVMLIDVGRWREADPVRFGAAYVETNGHVQQALDQELLNVCFSGDWLPLPLRWNVSPRLLNLDSWDAYNRTFFHQEAYAATTDPAIVHFLGPRKPWRWRSQVAWANEYLACARSSTFYQSRVSFLRWRIDAAAAEQRLRARASQRRMRRVVRSTNKIVQALLGRRSKGNEIERPDHELT